MRPRLLDLFCGAGGAAMGYHRAGFDVVGVDIKPQPNYPFEFAHDDALEQDPQIIANEFDAVHASPPCQAHSSIGRFARHRKQGLEHPDLIDPTRELLVATGLPYVIENVVGAPLRMPYMLCGSMFGLDVRRHRLFESSIPLMVPRCQHGVHTPRFASMGTRDHGRLASVIGVYGNAHCKDENLEGRSKAMGIDWMAAYPLSQAIPPAYTELIGHQLMQHLEQAAA